jgi:hypothetical protein
VVETEFVFDRLQAAELSAATASWSPNDPGAVCAQVRKRAVQMSNAAIYARVSSARQKEQEDRRRRGAAKPRRRSGSERAGPVGVRRRRSVRASLVRPALERLRDLVCQVPIDVLLVYSPDRLAVSTPIRRC